MVTVMVGIRVGNTAGSLGSVLLLLAALPACKQNADDKAAPSAVAPPASVAAPPSAPPVAAPVAATVKVPERAVGSGWTKESSRFVQAFKFSLPDSAPRGASFKDARAACEAVGRDLCSEDQWELACSTDDSVGKASSWTITPAGAAGWRLRGGDGCAMRADASDGAAVAGRIGLCCERRAAISTSKNRQESVMKAAQTYIEIIEKASNSGSPAEVTKLLAERAKVFKTDMTPEEAEKDLASDWKRWPKQNVRFFRCVADVAGQNGNFECDAVGTRTPASTNVPELAVFHVRFEYENFKYTVFADPTSILRKWGPY